MKIKYQKTVVLIFFLNLAMKIPEVPFVLDNRMVPGIKDKEFSLGETEEYSARNDCSVCDRSCP